MPNISARGYEKSESIPYLGGIKGVEATAAAVRRQYNFVSNRLYTYI